MMFTKTTVEVFGLAGVAGAIVLVQACATPLGTQCDDRVDQGCVQGEEPLWAQADEASAKPVPPAWLQREVVDLHALRRR